jgi:TusA-related sulfurtransferase
MSDIKPDEILDCVGSYCPVPLIQTREHIDHLEVGSVLEVLADDPAAEEDIKRFAKRTGHEIIKFEKTEDYIRFLIKKVKIGGNNER